VRRKPTDELISDILKLIYLVTKLNVKGQQEMTAKGGIPLILELCSEDHLMKKVAMAIMCSLVHAGPQVRAKLWQHGGVTIYLRFLNDQVQQKQALQGET
jgi:hypothetical protein